MVCGHCPPYSYFDLKSNNKLMKNIEYIEIDFYSEFWWDDEIDFFVQTDLHLKKVRIWIGYFYTILENIKRPIDNSWIGLTYYDQLDLGWHREKNWQLPCPNEVLLQLKSIELPLENPVNHMDYQTEHKIINTIIDILQEGIDGNFPVYMNDPIL